jgi:hypothetical protein
MRIPVHIVGMHETRNTHRLQTLGHGDDSGIVIYDGSRCYLDLELPDGTTISIDVAPATLDDVCRTSQEHLSSEENHLKRTPSTRFERILRDE